MLILQTENQGGSDSQLLNPAALERNQFDIRTLRAASVPQTMGTQKIHGFPRVCRQVAKQIVLTGAQRVFFLNSTSYHWNMESDKRVSCGSDLVVDQWSHTGLS